MRRLPYGATRACGPWVGRGGRGAADATTARPDGRAAPRSEAGSPQTVKVHPLVLFSILDHYTRRPETQDDGRVIGTLLGSVTEMPGGRQTIEIVNSFAVPHSEKGDEVAVGQIYNKTMFALHQRVNKREQVVGW